MFDAVPNDLQDLLSLGPGKWQAWLAHPFAPQAHFLHRQLDDQTANASVEEGRQVTFRTGEIECLVFMKLRGDGGKHAIPTGSHASLLRDGSPRERGFRGALHVTSSRLAQDIHPWGDA